jgi:hypothetical protein
MEWEAVATRWTRDDHTLLQPAEPDWILPSLYCNSMMTGKIVKKELELCAVTAYHYVISPGRGAVRWSL